VLERFVDFLTRRGARLELLFLDLEVDLLTEDGDLTRRLDSEPHLLAGDGKVGDLDVVADSARFRLTTSIDRTR
jgi:hypothetical protein